MFISFVLTFSSQATMIFITCSPIPSPTEVFLRQASSTTSWPILTTIPGTRSLSSQRSCDGRYYALISEFSFQTLTVNCLSMCSLGQATRIIRFPAGLIASKIQNRDKAAETITSSLRTVLFTLQLFVDIRNFEKIPIRKINQIADSFLTFLSWDQPASWPYCSINLWRRKRKLLL